VVVVGVVGHHGTASSISKVPELQVCSEETCTGIYARPPSPSQMISAAFIILDIVH